MKIKKYYVFIAVGVFMLLTGRFIPQPWRNYYALIAFMSIILTVFLMPDDETAPIEGKA